MELSDKNYKHIHVKIKYSKGRDCMFIVVYAIPNEENRRVLLEDLNQIAEKMDRTWMLGGDFNGISSISEKKGGAGVSLKNCNTFR